MFLSVTIERVMLRGVTHKAEDTSEYVFEVSPKLSDTLLSLDLLF